MKILMIHNFYQSSSPSGEDIVFKNEVELLRKNGIEVVTYERYNDEIKNFSLIDKLLVAIRNMWSWKTFHEIKDLIKKEKPDIVHFHNIWYLTSPSAYYACKDAGVPVVQTLHNFRIFCTNGLLMRNERICEECLFKKPANRLKVLRDRFKIIKNAIKYGCYRNSKLFSLGIAIAEYIHWIKRTWIDKIDAYIALSYFSKKKFIEAGLPEDKIFVKPNFLFNFSKPSFENKKYCIYIGRLSKEKGILTLIKTFKELKNIPLKIIGDGPQREEILNFIKRERIENIEYLGKRSHDFCIEFLKKASFLILPSECYESFPMAIIEAFACAKPVISSNIGSLSEIVKNKKIGLLFKVGDTKQLKEAVKRLFEDAKLYEELSKNARAEFERKYIAEKNFDMLLKIYKIAINNHEKRKDFRY